MEGLAFKEVFGRLAVDARLGDALAAVREVTSEDVEEAASIETVRKVLSEAADALQALEVEREALCAERTALGEEIASLRALAEQRLEMAKLGETYRSDLIDQALVDGVRAYGNDFAVDTYRGLLTASSIEGIKQLGADWRKTADGRLPKGRVTIEPTSVKNGNEGAIDIPVPAQAYS